MRRERLLPIFLILLATTTWAQQPVAAPSPPQAQGPATPPSAKIDPASGLPKCPSTLSKSDTKPIEVGGEIVDRLGRGVTPPQVKKRAKAPFPKESHKEMREHHVDEAEVVLAFVVGVNGKPKDICIEKSVGFGLDTVAAETAMKFRFQPATQDGKPVPVIIPFTVNFRLLQR